MPFDSSATYGASWANAVDATTNEISPKEKDFIYLFFNQLYVNLMMLGVEESHFCFSDSSVMEFTLYASLST